MWEIAVIVIIIIIFIYFLQKYITYEDYFYGFWTAQDDDFCDEGGITSMLLYIGEPTSGWFTIERQCFLIITDDICAQGLSITYGRGSGGTYDITVDFDDEQIWPESLKLDMDISRGSLKIYDDETVYAMLTKNHAITNAI